MGRIEPCASFHISFANSDRLSGGCGLIGFGSVSGRGLADAQAHVRSCHRLHLEFAATFCWRLFEVTMTPSTELELKIFRFAESAGRARWQIAGLAVLSNALQVTDTLLMDALDDLHRRKFMKFRQWSYPENDWVLYAGCDREYFNHDFHVRVTFSGRKYFESLEAEGTEEGRVNPIAVALLQKAGHGATLRELREAYSDLGKRPNPDLTGVVQHGVAALECTAKMIAGNTKGTLGDVLKQRSLALPPTLAGMLTKAWGFTSDRGRHVADGKPISYRDAELVLSLAEAMIVYLLRSPQVVDRP